MDNIFNDCDNDTTVATHLPLIGDAAPEFVADTTNGKLRFPEDYAGKWVILFSHPSDFTPVCTTEFMAFQAYMPKLRDLNTELVGLSVGAIPSHLAWINAIKNIEFNGWSNMEITFPVIADPTMRIAKMYGMVHPKSSETAAVRAVFIIDPRGVIRTILYYPSSTGRNFDELLRIIIALQTTDEFSVSTPANWMPGDDVIVPSPQTTDAMRNVLASEDGDVMVRSWFLISKHLGADTIYDRLTKAASPDKKLKKAHR